MAYPVDWGRLERNLKESTTHVEAFMEMSRDAGSIPAASTPQPLEPQGVGDFSFLVAADRQRTDCPNCHLPTAGGQDSPAEFGDATRTSPSPERGSCHDCSNGHLVASGLVPKTGPSLIAASKSSSGEAARSGDNLPQSGTTPRGLSSSHSSSLHRIAELWPKLPPHIREAVLTLVECSLPAEGTGEGGVR